jgi:hypothetical protein
MSTLARLPKCDLMIASHVLDDKRPLLTAPGHEREYRAA